MLTASPRRRFTDLTIRKAALLGTLAVVLSALPGVRVLATGAAGAGSALAGGLPAVGHVWTIVLENEDFARTFGTGQVESPYLSRTLVQQGAFVPFYFGTGHSSLDNYIAMTSGQGPNPATQGDCTDPSILGAGDPGAHFDADHQWVGKAGCTYPASVKAVATQLTDASFTWKGYMQDMDAQPGKFRTTCRGPSTEKIIETNPTGHPKSPDDYRAKHNPFVYYHSVTDDLGYCDAHDVPFGRMVADLASVATTPNFSFVVPNLCADGHDMPTCADGTVGGPSRYDEFLKTYIPQIEASPAYKKDGLIVVLFDEGVSGLSCCGEKTSPNVGGSTNSSYPFPGPLGTGGGQTGAVLLSSRFIKPGTVSTTSYNHYSYLRSMEDLFHLHHLGYSDQPGLVSFGADIFTAGG